MQKEAAWLLGELQDLVGRGVLDATTADKLRAHYGSAAATQGPGWGMILLAIGGAALVGLGVILIFAHNWEQWTLEMRVALSFAPLLLGQLAVFQALRSGSRWSCEGAGLFTALAVGASIALVGQTYQFGGDLPRFLLTWTLLALPLIYLLDASAVAGLYWLGAMAWVLFARSEGWWGSENSLAQVLRLPAFLLLICLPVPHLMRHIRIDRSAARVAWMLRVLLVVLVVGLAVAPGYTQIRALWFTYAALASVAALAGRVYFSGVHGLWGNPLEGAGRLGVFIMVLCATLGVMWREVALPQSSLGMLSMAFALAAVGLAWKAFQQGDRLLAPLLAAFTPTLWLLNTLAAYRYGLVTVLVHGYALMLAGALIRNGLQQNRLGLANQGAALIAALVLMRFFDSDLSYIVRGVGFIVTGASFFMAIAWLRRRVQVSA